MARKSYCLTQPFCRRTRGSLRPPRPRPPHIGRQYRQSPAPDTRRVVLRGTRYHVYYVPCSEEVRVLAVWHARRGVGPRSERPKLVDSFRQGGGETVTRKQGTETSSLYTQSAQRRRASRIGAVVGSRYCPVRDSELPLSYGSNRSRSLSSSGERLTRSNSRALSERCTSALQ